MDRVLLKESVSYLSESLVNVINESPKFGVLNKTGRVPELRLSIWMMPALMMNIIIDLYLS